MIRSTAGWQICIQWKDGLTSWHSLKDLEESHPVQTTEFAVVQWVDHEPAFNFCVDQVLKKHGRIISLVKKRNARYLKKTHKFCIKMTKTMAEAYMLNKKNENTLWVDAIDKEMKEVKVSFEVLEDGERVSVRYQHVPMYMVFDVKMKDFGCKARLVASNNMTEPPAAQTYANIVL